MNRKSRQREAIIGLLGKTDTHPTAEWLHEQVKKEIPNVSLATIYRNLRLLEAAGEITRLWDPGGAAHFDGNAGPHYHFRCDRCGRIMDLKEPADRTIEIKVASATGLDVTHHHLELGGLCLDCRKLDNR